MMDALRSCKQHGEPVNVNDVEKMKSFIEKEIIAEAVFLKRTNASNIRPKYKVGSMLVKLTLTYLYYF